MAVRTGKVIMAQKIRMDRGYKNVISYDEDEIVTLLTNNAVAVFNNCSFTKPGENVITIEMSYGNAIKCNYVGFQNPDYSNKWFFAFIDEIEYIADDTVNVHYTIDEFSTWYSYWSPEPCFVEREHVNVDTIGANVIPEPVELGEYVANAEKIGVSFAQGSSQDIYCLTSIYAPTDSILSNVNLGTNVCGIPISGAIFAFERWDEMAMAVQQYSANQHLDTITSAFIIPAGMTDLTNTTDWSRIQYTVGSDIHHFYKFNGRNTPFNQDVTITAPTTLNGYTPVNQKLLTSPYMCLVLSNTAGSSTVLAYEYFSNRSACVLETVGTPVVGSSIFTFPVNYKGNHDNFIEGISGGKFPTLSWSGDAYTNWLTQNAVNIGMGVLGNVAVGVIGAGAMATGNPLGAGGIATSVAGIAGQAHELIQHAVTPEVSVGNVNVGDVLTCMRSNRVFAYPRSIRYDMAQRIDDFFTRYGYQVNTNKIPNQFGRTNWNYIKIAAGEDIGIPSPTGPYSVISIPPDSMEAINNIFRAGVTIWHNHANLGNFALANPIGS